ncbi:unnamed protein product [Malus baccata var. baccata]
MTMIVDKMYKFSAPRFFGFSLSYIKDENDDDKHKAESELSTTGGIAIHRFGGRDGVEGTRTNLVD